jgi:hypothetical protein
MSSIVRIGRRPAETIGVPTLSGCVIHAATASGLPSARRTT